MIELSKSIAENCKKYIYGFDYYTRSIFFDLAAKGYYINGFVVEEITENMPSSYLNKRLYNISELDKDESIIVYDIFGKNISYIKQAGFRAETLLYTKIKDKVCIYGAGKYGKIYYNYLKQLGIDIVAFCDRNLSKIGTVYCGKPVISPSEFINEDLNLLLGIASENLVCVEKSIHEELEIKEYYKFELQNYISLSNNNDVAFRALHLSYIFETLNYRSVYFLGDDMSLKNAKEKFELFDIHIKGIQINDIDNDVSDNNDNISPYELLYDNSKHIIVYVLAGFEKEAERIYMQLGEPENIFMSMNYEKFRRYGYEIILDVNNGYNMKYKSEIGLVRLGNRKGKRIAILGGSTSDAKLYPEKTWPECFEKILLKNDKSADIYCGAVQGYVISQEITKFLRDILPIRPNMLIMYTGLNDASQDNLRFSHYYQDELYEFLSNNSRKKVYSANVKDRTEYWNDMVNAIQAICDCFGIQLFVFTNPTIYTKLEKNNYEKQMEIIEEDYYCMTEYPHKKNMDIIRNIVNMAKKKEYNNISSNIFENEENFYFIDAFHLTSEGNMLLANKIYNTIEDDL